MLSNSLFKYLFTLLFFLCYLFNGIKVFAQGELNCNVTIDASQVDGNSQNKAILEEIKTAITNFMNSRKWTNDNFNPEERIRCNISINVTELSGVGSVLATAQIQSSRPVYGGAYETVMLNFLDNTFNFSYLPGTPLDFNENIYTSELTSLLGFYAYVIIGMDYDSFSELGGTIYFDKVRNIVANVTNPTSGWKVADDPNNRAGLSENFNNQLITPMREGMYTYHRIILDDYIKKPEENYKKLLEILQIIKTFNNAKRPNAIVVKSFFNSKLTELIGMLGQADPETKKKSMELLTEMDPSNTQKYQKIFSAD